MENFLILTINQLKYFGIFLGAFIEGPLTGILVGSLIRKGVFFFFGGYLLHLIGDFSADAIYYFAGYFNSQRLLKKFTKWFKVSFQDIEKARGNFLKHPDSAVVIGKLTHFLGLPVLIAAGLARYSWKKFLVLNFLATAIKSAILIGLGWYLMDQWQKAENIFAYLNLAGTIILLLVGSYFVLKYFKKKLWIN